MKDERAETPGDPLFMLPREVIAEAAGEPGPRSDARPPHRFTWGRWVRSRLASAEIPHISQDGRPSTAY